MAREADGYRPIVKRMLPGRRGPLPAGLARLTDARHLLVVIDEGHAEQDAAEHDETADVEEEATAEHPAAELADTVSEPAREIWYLGSEDAVEAAEAREQATDDPDQTESDGPQEAIQETETEVEAQAEAEHPAEPELTAVSAESKTSGEQSSDQEIFASSEQVAAVDEPAPREPAPPEPAPVQRATGPVRFVWRTDADGKFSQVSPEFALAVGELAADVVGRRFQDVANAFGLDPAGDIAGLLARRDTWSGRTVAWPVAGTDLKIPVDLAALPVYDRNRNFEGFRGFGVARTGDASIDPEGIGLVLVRLPEAADEPDGEAPSAATIEEPKAGNAEPSSDIEADVPLDETPDDPFRGEKPALSVAPAPDRRFSDKVIRLAEHRSPANDRGTNGNAGASERSLSTGERIAFQQIGERLKKESGAATEAGKAKPGASKPARGKVTERPEAGKPENLAAEQAATEEPDETIAEAEDVADLQALDGVTDSKGQGEAPEESEPETPAPARQAARPGMSLLDFAQWGNDEPAATEPDEPEAAAQVEMDEAAALDERTPRILLDDDAETKSASAETAHEAGTAEMEPAEPEPELELELESELEPESKLAAPASTETGVEVSDPTPPDAAEQKSGLSILEKLPVPVLVHSGDTLHYANDEFFALTGYRLGRAAGGGRRHRRAVCRSLRGRVRDRPGAARQEPTGRCG